MSSRCPRVAYPEGGPDVIFLERSGVEDAHRDARTYRRGYSPDMWTLLLPLALALDPPSGDVEPDVPILESVDESAAGEEASPTTGEAATAGEQAQKEEPATAEEPADSARVPANEGAVQAPTAASPATADVARPPAEADPRALALYERALEAWEWGRWEEAYALASDALGLEPDDAPALLVQGFALSRMGDWESGVGVVRGLVEDEEVGAHARFWLRRHDRRWTRSDYAVAVSILARNDRASSFPIWQSGLGLSVDVPITKRLRFDQPRTEPTPLLSRFTVRVDAITPAIHDDDLRLFGVALGAVPVYHLTMRTWSFHGGLGPLLHLGQAESWTGQFTGLFPGMRATLGLDARMSRRMGTRVGLDYDLQFGARRFLNGVSHGPVFRWALVFYP
jgi:hypothetical protein